MNNESISEKDSSLTTSEDPAISIMESDPGDESMTLKVDIKKQEDPKRTSLKIRRSIKKDR